MTHDLAIACRWCRGAWSPSQLRVVHRLSCAGGGTAPRPVPRSPAWPLIVAMVAATEPGWWRR